MFFADQVPEVIANWYDDATRHAAIGNHTEAARLRRLAGQLTDASMAGHCTLRIRSDYKTPPPKTVGKVTRQRRRRV